MKKLFLSKDKRSFFIYIRLRRAGFIVLQLYSVYAG